MDLWRWIRDWWHERVRPGVLDRAYRLLDTRLYERSYDGGVIVEKAISLGVPAVYVSMNYR